MNLDLSSHHRWSNYAFLYRKAKDDAGQISNYAFLLGQFYDFMDQSKRALDTSAQFLNIYPFLLKLQELFQILQSSWISEYIYTERISFIAVLYHK